MPTDPARRAYSINEVVDALGITRPTLYKLLEDGRLRSIHIGRRHLIVAESLDELLASAA